MVVVGRVPPGALSGTVVGVLVGTPDAVGTGPVTSGPARGTEDDAGGRAAPQADSAAARHQPATSPRRGVATPLSRRPGRAR